MSKKYIFLSFFIFTVHFFYAQCPQLVWSDEFEGTNLDLNSWEQMTGDGCNLGICNWGNNELQFYSGQNTEISDGTMKIIAKQQAMGGLSYTSSRIRTINKVDVRFGRIEARIKMPIGKGLWPAFWMLPTDEVFGGWPKSGEIDIVELLGDEPSKIFGTLHFGNDWPDNRSTSANYEIQNTTFADDFHEYAIEWSQNEIKWYLDGKLYSTKVPTDLGGFTWPFNQDFHLLLNMAVGGNFPGSPDGTTVFPQTMEVDYVRIYDMVGLPEIVGPDKVNNMAEGISYQIQNMPTNASIEWTIPDGATIVSGEGTGSIVVNFGETSGAVTAAVTSDCAPRNLSIEVRVQAELEIGEVLENFDDPDAQITYTFSTGTYTDNFANPDKEGGNSSDLCGEYVRDGGSQYDVLVYASTAITNANEFSNESKILNIDILTDAPIGTEVLLQFEDQSATSSSNYPTGRHSRYQLFTTKQNEWETLTLNFLDRPDGGVATNAVDELIILFAPNSTTDNTFLYDNLQILEPLNTSTSELSMDLNNGFTLSPNPASNVVTVESIDENEISRIKIYDIGGKEIFNLGSLTSQSHNLDVSEYVAGIYFVKVENKNNLSQVLKLVVK